MIVPLQPSTITAPPLSNPSIHLALRLPHIQALRFVDSIRGTPKANHTTGGKFESPLAFP